MSARHRAIVLVIAAIVAPGSGRSLASSKYLDLEPGWSKRADADRVLGASVLTIGDRLFEYKPQEGTGPIFVEVQRGADAIIDRVEVGLTGKVDRAALVDAMQLPAQSAAAIVTGGILMEYFGDGRAVVLTYQASSASSDVVSIGHYSDARFDRDLERRKAQLESGEGAPPAKTTATTTPTPTTPTTTPPVTTGSTGDTAVAPTPPQSTGFSNIPPSIRRNHLGCYDLYLWSQREEEQARRSRQVAQRQMVMDIRISSQSGDCERARALAGTYKKQFGGN